MKQHIVKTCRSVDDVEPSTLPSIPKGTYGICPAADDSECPPVDFGPPWGVQRVSNADLLDAAAVLENAKRAITLLKRPWRIVMRRTLRSFAGPYLVTAVYCDGFYDGDFSVEAWLYKRGSKKKSLALLDRAVALTGQRPSRK